MPRFARSQGYTCNPITNATFVDIVNVDDAINVVIESYSP
jgi:hypothetical protein